MYRVISFILLVWALCAKSLDIYDDQMCEVCKYPDSAALRMLYKPPNHCFIPRPKGNYMRGYVLDLWKKNNISCDVELGYIKWDRVR